MRPIAVIQEEINAKESHQLELLKVMSDSDAHASKCTKLGLNFAETYPDDLAAYVAAREQYNAVEQALIELYNELEEARREEGERPAPQAEPMEE